MFKPATSSFSNLLVEKWSPQLLESSTIGFRANTRVVLDEFTDFKKKYEKTIKDFFDSSFPEPIEVTRKDLWITEQINLALDQFWEPIAHLAEQIRSVPYLEFFSNDSKLNEALDRFKTNIQTLLGQPAEHLVGNILVYFNKTTKINRFPYTDKALIGIPYRVLTQNQRERKTWMPIAHELGHHIYWNMASYIDLPSQKESFERGILKIQKTDHGLIDEVKYLLKPWLEEIFADAIGLQISGSNSVERQKFLESSKELILRKTDNEKANLSLDDGEHVPDGLRLLVSLASLKTGDPVLQWKDFLEKEVGKKADEIEINLRDEFGEPLPDTIAATAVAGQICNTVNIILAEIEKFREGRDSLFKIQSSPIDDFASVLLEAAKKMGKNNPNATLAFALNPEILEGGQGGTGHTHSLTHGSANNHTHPNSSKTHSH
jgi:hypothetical protein